MSEDVKAILRAEMDKRGLHDNTVRAGLAAIIGGESEFVPKWETGYCHTANDRIRHIFPSRVHDLSDVQLNQIKTNDETWFNFIYGSQFKVGRDLGNIEPNDGYRFRGGGLIQLTGRFNYAKYGRLAGFDLIAKPELIIEPNVAAAVAIEYFKDRFKGGDFAAMKTAVGNSVGEPDARKNQLFAQFLASGEWNYSPNSSKVAERDSKSAVEIPDDMEPLDPIVVTFLEATENVQRLLKNLGLYNGRIDRDFGQESRKALQTYLKGD